MPRKKAQTKPVEITRLTDVIQHPQEALNELMLARQKWHDLERLPPPSKLIVSGSRVITDYTAVKESIETGLKKLRLGKPLILVEGEEPRGVDALAKRWAIENKIKVDPVPAEWGTYGLSAGPVRNRLMAQKGEALIAIWNGISPGTANMIAWAAVYGLPTYVVLVGPAQPEEERSVVNPNKLCGKVAPASKACVLGKKCICIQVEGHTTPHRAKCGARWANRKRS